MARPCWITQYIVYRPISDLPSSPDSALLDYPIHRLSADIRFTEQSWRGLAGLPNTPVYRPISDLTSNLGAALLDLPRSIYSIFFSRRDRWSNHIYQIKKCTVRDSNPQPFANKAKALTSCANRACLCETFLLLKSGRELLPCHGTVSFYPVTIWRQSCRGLAGSTQYIVYRSNRALLWWPC